MDTLRYKDYEGTTEIDIERGVCRGKVLFIADLVTYESDTPRELQRAFQDAVDDYIDTCKLVGKEPQKPFKGQFNVRISPDLHRAAALRAVQEEASLNEIVARSIECYLHSGSSITHNHQVTVKLEGNTDLTPSP